MDGNTNPRTRMGTGFQRHVSGDELGIQGHGWEHDPRDMYRNMDSGTWMGDRNMNSRTWMGTGIQEHGWEHDSRDMYQNRNSGTTWMGTEIHGH